MDVDKYKLIMLESLYKSRVLWLDANSYEQQTGGHPFRHHLT
jgi:hypothetical protein